MKHRIFLLVILQLFTLNTYAVDFSKIVVQDDAKFNALTQDPVRNFIKDGKPTSLESFAQGSDKVACSADYFKQAKIGDVFTFNSITFGQTKYFKSTNVILKNNLGMVAVNLKCMSRDFQNVSASEFQGHFSGILEFK